MTRFMMLVGLPASGKSSMADFLSTIDYNIHSSDEIRKELFGSYDMVEKEHHVKVFEELHKRIKRDLKEGKNVVYDATNINRKRRMGFLQELKNIKCHKTALFFATSYEECLGRNNFREKSVPEEVIKRMYMNFDLPFYFEGWDKITPIFLKAQIGIPDIHDLFNGEGNLNELEHDNPNHSLTVGKHMFQTLVELGDNFMKEDEEDYSLSQAALFHDIGKGFCKTFTNSKGEPTKIAHYYQHHLVGAYMMALISLKRGESYEDFEEICGLIAFHMLPHMIKKEKTIDKYKKMLGEEFWNKLMILHAADKAAH